LIQRRSEGSDLPLKFQISNYFKFEIGAVHNRHPPLEPDTPFVSIENVESPF